MIDTEIEQLQGQVAARRLLKRGDALFRAGEPFKSVYVVYTGFLKSSVASTSGREQVTGFHMAGELVGWDGLNSGRHICDVLALEETDVRLLPYDKLENAANAMPMLRLQMHKSMSREIVRDHEVMLLLGSLRAEERLAAFLVNLSQRFKACGCPHSEFVLPMTRAEIGSFLGLKLETVSRAFSQFDREGLIEVNHRHVRIVDAAGLRQVVRGRAPESTPPRERPS
ncbi:MAG: helix-turn-helix domain-containing protein [Tepidisphaeraceae bacterium]